MFVRSRSVSTQEPRVLSAQDFVRFTQVDMPMLRDSLRRWDMLYEHYDAEICDRRRQAFRVVYGYDLDTRASIDLCLADRYTACVNFSAPDGVTRHVCDFLPIVIGSRLDRRIRARYWRECESPRGAGAKSDLRKQGLIVQNKNLYHFTVTMATNPKVAHIYRKSNKLHKVDSRVYYYDKNFRGNMFCFKQSILLIPCASCLDVERRKSGACDGRMRCILVEEFQLRNCFKQDYLLLRRFCLSDSHVAIVPILLKFVQQHEKQQHGETTLKSSLMREPRKDGKEGKSGKSCKGGTGSSSTCNNREDDKDNSKDNKDNKEKKVGEDGQEEKENSDMTEKTGDTVNKRSSIDRDLSGGFVGSAGTPTNAIIDADITTNTDTDNTTTNTTDAGKSTKAATDVQPANLEQMLHLLSDCATMFAQLSYVSKSNESSFHNDLRAFVSKLSPGSTIVPHIDRIHVRATNDLEFSNLLFCDCDHGSIRRSFEESFVHRASGAPRGAALGDGSSVQNKTENYPENYREKLIKSATVTGQSCRSTKRLIDSLSEPGVVGSSVSGVGVATGITKMPSNKRRSTGSDGGGASPVSITQPTQPIQPTLPIFSSSPSAASEPPSSQSPLLPVSSSVSSSLPSPPVSSLPFASSSSTSSSPLSSSSSPPLSSLPFASSSSTSSSPLSSRPPVMLTLVDNVHEFRKISASCFGTMSSGLNSGSNGPSSSDASSRDASSRNTSSSDASSRDASSRNTSSSVGQNDQSDASNIGPSSSSGSSIKPNCPTADGSVDHDDSIGVNIAGGVSGSSGSSGSSGATFDDDGVQRYCDQLFVLYIYMRQIVERNEDIDQLCNKCVFDGPYLYNKLLHQMHEYISFRIEVSNLNSLAVDTLVSRYRQLAHTANLYMLISSKTNIRVELSNDMKRSLKLSIKREKMQQSEYILANTSRPIELMNGGANGTIATNVLHNLSKPVAVSDTAEPTAFADDSEAYEVNEKCDFIIRSRFKSKNLCTEMSADQKRVYVASCNPGDVVVRQLIAYNSQNLFQNISAAHFTDLEFVHESVKRPSVANQHNSIKCSLMPRGATRFLSYYNMGSLSSAGRTLNICSRNTVTFFLDYEGVVSVFQTWLFEAYHRICRRLFGGPPRRCCFSHDVDDCPRCTRLLLVNEVGFQFVRWCVCAFVLLHVCAFVLLHVCAFGVCSFVRLVFVRLCVCAFVLLVFVRLCFWCLCVCAFVRLCVCAFVSASLCVCTLVR
ncbi:MdSGHV070 [Apis mellifera filamentous virus]|nr:MdSGHV070 [Apis mellifera filamentous virus]